MDQNLKIIDHALGMGHYLNDGDRKIVDAYRRGSTTVTPDPTTEPYTRDEIHAAVLEIAEECAAVCGTPPVTVTRMLSVKCRETRVPAGARGSVETSTTTYGECPCGNGDVVEITVSGTHYAVCTTDLI